MQRCYSYVQLLSCCQPRQHDHFSQRSTSLRFLNYLLYMWISTGVARARLFKHTTCHVQGTVTVPDNAEPIWQKKRVRYPHDGTNLCLCFGGKVECQYLFVLSESCGVSDKYIVTCSSSFQERGETRDESHWNTSMSRPACRDQEVASTATRTFVARILRWLQCHFFDSHQSPFTMQETSYAGQWCFRADHCFSVIDTR